MSNLHDELLLLVEDSTHQGTDVSRFIKYAERQARNAASQGDRQVSVSAGALWIGGPRIGDIVEAAATYFLTEGLTVTMTGPSRLILRW